MGCPAAYADNKEMAIEMIHNMSQKELLRQNHILSVGDIEVRSVGVSQKRIVA